MKTDMRLYSYLKNNSCITSYVFIEAQDVLNRRCRTLVLCPVYLLLKLYSFGDN
jgi:hypothetical protein